jgi:tRNA threonylcarbamoyl adenosine modification protein (Sua5/YciO/YrdC/YwlC family)
MLLQIHPDNPDENKLRKIIEILKNGGVIIYPTDTVYGIGCDITHPKAIERIARIKGIRMEKNTFSFICYDLSHLSDYTLPITNTTFRLMKKNLPGAFTFILPANHKVPKLLKSKRKTVGIRIPDNTIARQIVLKLGNPIVTTSLPDQDTIKQYPTDPELIHEVYQDLVDVVIDGGFGSFLVSTVVDCTEEEYQILRQGKGELLP